MPISMECPSCLNTFSPPDTMAGRKTKCPHCQFVLFVPRAESDAAATAPPQVAAAPDRKTPAKKSRAIITAAADDKPFAFNERKSSRRPRRREEGGWGTLLLAAFVIVGLGVLLLLGAAGAAAWYFWGEPSKGPTAEVKKNEPEPEPKKTDKEEPADKEKPKEEQPKEEDPPNRPDRKPVRDKPARDKIDDRPPPMRNPDPEPMPMKPGRLTLSPIPQQTLKAGERAALNVSVFREDCKGDVRIDIAGGLPYVRLERSFVLPAEIDRKPVLADIDDNAPPGKYVLTVTARLGNVTTSTSTELIVEKPAPVVVAPPPPDPKDPPLQLTNTRIMLDGRPYEGHKGAVECVALSRDKKWAASGGVDGNVQLWDLAKGEAKRLHSSTDRVIGGVTAIAYSADGKWIASGDSYGGVFIHDPATLETRVASWNKWVGLVPRDNPVRSIAISPKGDIFVATTKRFISSWETATGKQLTVNDKVQNAGTVRFGPDGDKCYAVNGTRITVFNPQTGDATFLGTDPDKPTDYFATTFDIYPTRNELIAVGQQDKAAELMRIDLTTGRKWTVAELTGDEVPACVAVADRAGCALTGDKQGRLRVYSLDRGKELLRANAHKGEIRGLAVSDDGRRAVSASTDTYMNVYYFFNDGDKVRPPQPPDPPAAARDFVRRTTVQAHKGEARKVAFSPDGKWLVSGGADGKVVVLDPANGKVVKDLDKQSKGAPIVSLCFSGDSKLLLIANSGRENDSGYATLWDAEAWKLKGFFLNGHKNEIGAVALTQDGKRALSLGGNPRAVVSWDVASRRASPAFADEKLDTSGAALDADALRAVTMSATVPSHVTLWDLKGKKSLAKADVKTRYNELAFSGDGKHVVACGSDPALVVYDVDTFKPKVLWERGSAFAAALSHDGKLAAVGLSDGQVSVWDVEKGRELYSAATKLPARPLAAAFSAQADLLAIADQEGHVHILSMREPK
jgi:WD40 repeat protein